MSSNRVHELALPQAGSPGPVPPVGTGATRRRLGAVADPTAGGDGFEVALVADDEGRAVITVTVWDDVAEASAIGALCPEAAVTLRDLLDQAITAATNQGGTDGTDAPDPR